MSGIIGGVGSKSGVIGETETDYEEGYWTISGTNATIVPNDTTTNTMKYVKIGRLVFVTGYALISSGTSGGLVINGLPFTVDPYAYSMGSSINSNSITDNIFAPTRAMTNTAQLDVRKPGNTPVNGNQFTGTTSFIFSHTYYATN
jgi:hypothetical protein